MNNTVYDDSFTITITNHLTGEMSDIEVKNPDQAAYHLEELTASEKAIKAAVAKLKGYLDKELGEDDRGRFGNFEIIRTQRETKTWTREGLNKVGLDEDAIAVISTINMTAARQLVDEAIERGEIAPDSKKQLNEMAEINTTKPFLTFKKVS